MAAKVEIANATHSTEEIASILSDYTSAKLLEQTQLFGGYSGSSYRVDLDDGSRYVLKIQNGYSLEHAELMCRTTNHLNDKNYTGCCLPVLLLKRGASTENDNNAGNYHRFQFVSKKEKKGEPALLLNYIKGRQADAVMRDNPNIGSTVMKGIGAGLGKMHSSTSGMTRDEAARLKIRWYQTDGGCCDVQDQIDGKVLSDIMLCKDERKRDEYLEKIYSKELSFLRDEMKLANTDNKLSHGILHGDPFADNVLVNEKNGEFSAFIDIEDVCVGPILFDLCCCAIGCCFKEKEKEDDSKAPQVLDFSLLDALLDGYNNERKMPQIEHDHFIAFMRLTLLCNCSWRFVKFNVKSSDKDLPETVKNSYLELQNRIEYLYEPKVVERINSLLNKYL